MEKQTIVGRRDKHYECTRCHRSAEEGVTRETLMVKKVMFLGMGAGGRTYKSRVVDWLCPYCINDDPEWGLESFVAPGSKMYQQVAKPVPLDG